MSDSSDDEADNYKIIETIGKGIFSRVYKADDKQNHRQVALKKISYGSSRESVAYRRKCACREADLLKKLKHENIIGIYDVIRREVGLTLVLEFAATNLRQLLTNHALSRGHVKAIMRMLIGGLKHLHGNGVVHRDVKPSNLLVATDGTLKIADLGMSRELGESMTPQVVTLQYRSPEVILHPGSYDQSVDMWSCGCILAEMLGRKSLVEQGGSDLDQLSKIFSVLGKPKITDYENLPEHFQFLLKSDNNGGDHSRVFEEKFPEDGSDVHDMLKGLFQFDCRKRWSCEVALESEYFSSQPPVEPLKVSTMTKRKRTANISRISDSNLPIKRLFS